MASIGTRYGSVSYNIAGSGDPLILLHGLGTSKAAWGEQMAFADSGYEVIALDLSGFGETERSVNVGYSIEQYAEELRETLRRLRIDKVNLIGTSMGGFIAQRFALDHPGMVVNLILCHTACQMSMPPDILRARLEALARMEMREYGRLVAAQALGSAHQAALLETVAAMIAKNSKEIYRRVLTEGLASFDICDEAQGIAPPCLVIVGSEDRVIPPESSYEMAGRIPGAQVVTLAGAGHLSYMEVPGEFNRRVLDFLQAQSNEDERTAARPR